MNIKEFKKLINLQEDEVEGFNFYIKYRGFHEHVMVYEFLNSLNININYSKIATTFRYDKRIRRILFKYIGFIEEYLRADICNKFDLKKYHLEYYIDEKYYRRLRNRFFEAKSTFEFIQDTTFSELIYISSLISKNYIYELFPKYTQMNAQALINLRNAISHNKFLLNSIELKPCVVNNYKSTSLRNNVLNIYQLLPEFMKEEFKKEINRAKRKYNKNDIYQVEYNLPKEIILKI